MHTLSLLIGIALGIFVMGAVAYVVSLVGKKSRETSDMFRDVFDNIGEIENRLTRNTEELEINLFRELEAANHAISKEVEDRNAAIHEVYGQMDSRIDKHVHSQHKG